MSDHESFRRLAAVLHDIDMLLSLRSHSNVELVALTPTEHEILRIVQRHPGIRLSAVAERVGMAGSNMSAAVSKLADIDLIDKGVDERDRRAVSLRLTDLALANIESLEKGWGGALEAGMGRLDEAGRDAIWAAADALESLHSSL